MALTIASGVYIWKLRNYLDDFHQEEENDLRIDNIGLSHKAEQTLNAVLDEPMLQSELPGELNVSKATVSNAVSELFDRDLVIKKKKANTYRIEPNIEEIEKKQR